MAITYDAPSNTITVVGNYTDLFNDIYNQDQASGWNVFHKQGNRQFYSEAYIKIGDGSTPTTVSDIRATIEFDTSLTGNTIEQDKSSMTWGVLVDADKRVTRDGVCYLFNANSNVPILADADSVTNLYSCSFYCLSQWYPRNEIYLQGSGKVYNCVFSGVDFYGWSANMEVYGIRLCCDRWAFNICNCNIEDVFVSAYSTSAGTYFFNCDYHVGDVTLKNVVGRHVKWGFYFGYYHSNMRAINCDLDNWIITWAGNNYGTLWRQYEFNAHCQDKNGNDLGGVLAVGEYTGEYGQAFSETTNEYGDIVTQTVDHGFFVQEHGSEEQVKIPLKVTYSKPGYQTVVKYYDMTEKTKDVVVLHKAVGVFVDMGRPVVNLKKSDPENKNVMVL